MKFFTVFKANPVFLDFLQFLSEPRGVILDAHTATRHTHITMAKDFRTKIF